MTSEASPSQQSQPMTHDVLNLAEWSQHPVLGPFLSSIGNEGDQLAAVRRTSAVGILYLARFSGARSSEDVAAAAAGTSTSLLRDMLDVIDREGRWPDGLSRPALLPAVGGDPFQPEVPSEIAGSASAGVPSHLTSNQPQAVALAVALEEERWRSPPQTPPPRPKRSSSPGARMVLTQGSSAAARGREMAKLGSP
ncbi:unnamed protein product, partial [Polarella glacialis]